MKKKRAQIWSADFLVSILIFFSVIILVIFAWNFVGYQNAQQMNFNNMENSVLFLSDLLIRTSGEPEAWNESNVETIGLASAENILDAEKVESFMRMDYDVIVAKLGASGNLHFELNDINDNIVQNREGENITKGIYPTEDATMVVPIERYCIYNNEIVKLRLIIWQ